MQSLALSLSRSLARSTRTAMPEELVTVVLVGDTRVGKTALARRYTDDAFDATYTPTSGVEYHMRRDIPCGAKKATLRIWDTSGAGPYLPISLSYLRAADAVLVVFDTQRPATLASVGTWMREVRSRVTPGTVVWLVGARADKADRVFSAKADQVAAAHNCVYVETSALCAVRVELLFDELIGAVLRRRAAVGVPAAPEARTITPDTPQDAFIAEPATWWSCWCI